MKFDWKFFFAQLKVFISVYVQENLILSYRLELHIINAKKVLKKIIVSEMETMKNVNLNASTLRKSDRKSALMRLMMSKFPTAFVHCRCGRLCCCRTGNGQTSTITMKKKNRKVVLCHKFSILHFFFLPHRQILLHISVRNPAGCAGTTARRGLVLELIFANALLAALEPTEQ